MDKKYFPLVAAFCLAIGFAGVAVLYQFSVAGKGSGGNSIVAPNFGGPFELTDHTGQGVTEKDYQGYRLIYFGFTFCPAICPTELAKMTEVLNALGEKGEQITPIFITVDPERDTQEVMAQYRTLFHPRLVGLTGTPEQIEQVTKAYKVYYAKVDDPSLSEYTMDHSSYIYFMDPENTLLALYKIDQTAEEIVKDIKTRL